MGACSQESEDSTLALSEQESKPSGKSSVTIIADGCLPAISPMLNGTVTCELSESTTCLPLTSSVVDSLAKIFQTLEREQE